MATSVKPSRVAFLFASSGGLAQIVAALTVLFLPVLGQCEMALGGQLVCSRLSYIQLGGNALGYGLLLLMVAIGVLAVGSTRDVNYRRVVIIRWVGALLSLVVAVITGWSFGLVFVPGAVLLLLAALRTRPQSA